MTKMPRRELEDDEFDAIRRMYQSSLVGAEIAQTPQSPIYAETIDGAEYVEFGDHAGTFAVFRKMSERWRRVSEEQWPERYRNTGTYELPSG